MRWIAFLILPAVLLLAAACEEEDGEPTPTATTVAVQPTDTLPPASDTPEPTAKEPTATPVPQLATAPKLTRPCWAAWLEGVFGVDPCSNQNGWTDELWFELNDGFLDPLPFIPPGAFGVAACYTDYTMVHYTPDELLALDEERGAEWYDHLAALPEECGSLD